jgi:hypothetical protein
VRRCISYAAAALLLAAGVGAAACGGDDDSEDSRDTTDETTEETTGEPESHDKAAYVALLKERNSDQFEGVTDEQVECILGGLVDAVGVAELEAAGVFDSVEDNPDATLAENGLALDEAASATFYASLNGCVDVRAWFKQALADGSVSPEAASCVVDHVDDPTLTRLWAVAFTGGQAALVADPELGSAFEQATRACVTTDTSG